MSACVEEQRRAHECVALIAREERRDALRLRYLCGMTWERVCVETGYSYRHVMRIKSEALSEALRGHAARVARPVERGDRRVIAKDGTPCHTKT